MAIKKVLFVCSIYKPNVGGVEIAIEQASKYLRNRNVDATILTKEFPYGLRSYEVVDNTHVVRIKRPIIDFDFILRTSEIINYEQVLKADVVHVIGVRRPMPLFALLLARRWSVPCVITFAGNDLPQIDNLESQKIWAEGQNIVEDSIRQADFWTTFANHTAEVATSVFPNISPKVIQGGVDLDTIHKSKAYQNESPYFFAARRLESSKGIDVLIKAFADISAQLPSYELIIAGDGTERENLEYLAKSLSAKVRFIGTIDQSSVFSYMKGAVAHICPSRSESGGLVNYEAQAAGCIAIGSNVGGIPEYIKDGQTGLLFENENKEDLSQKLLLVASNNKQIQTIRRDSLEESKKCGWDTFIDTYLDIYQKIIDDMSLKTQFDSWSELTDKLSKQLLSR